MYLRRPTGQRKTWNPEVAALGILLFQPVVGGGIENAQGNQN